MPTPINHLVMAQEVLASRRLSSRARRLLESAKGAFLLGHTAPDVQTVSGQPRQETHFYAIPPVSDTPAHRAFLLHHPELAQAGRLTPAHAAMLAGYLAHLLADEAWWREVFHPIFGPEARWGSWEERRFLHNVLRTYLDRQDQARLNGTAWEALAATEPHRWLPFVRDDDLRAWRDYLVEQLHPGRRVLTAEVFAARMDLPPERVEAALNSPEQMARIRRHAPPSVLRAYRARVRRRSTSMINDYLGESR